MKTLLWVILLVIGLISVAFASGGLTFNAQLPSATQGTLGVNQQLEIQGAAISEIRTKMNTWAVYTGYSTGRAGR